MNILNKSVLGAAVFALALTGCYGSDNNDADTTRVSETTTTYESVENNMDAAVDTAQEGMSVAVNKTEKMANKTGHAMKEGYKDAKHAAHDAGHKMANAMDANDGDVADRSLVMLTASDPQFSTLNSLIRTAGLAGALESGEYTVFAPTNAAFEKVPQATMDKLGKNKEALKQVLLYHVVEGQVPAEKVVTLTEAAPLREGNPVMITTTTDGAVMLDNAARVIKTDVMANNGIVHVIDTVLVPSDLVLK